MKKRSNDDAPVQHPQTPTSTPTPQPSQGSSYDMGAPSVVRAGEIMLIFSLLLIFLVAFFVALHFYLRKRKRRSKTKPTKKPKQSTIVPELHSQQKNVAELVGTPVCEIADSEPRQEMEDVEVHEVYIQPEVATDDESEVLEPGPEPEVREFAVYWSSRM